MNSVQELKSLDISKPARHYYQNNFKTERPLNLNSEENIFIRKAITINDIRKVFDVRWEGYKKYFKTKDEVLDLADFSPHTTLLLAEDEDNNVLGTLRIIDRRYGRIELDEFINVDSLIPGKARSCIEATRFSIPNHSDSKSIKFLLWKALLLYCQINDVNTIVMSARPAAARAYRCLLFEDAGSSGVYYHPLLGNLEHRTYKFNISEKKHLLKERDFSLYYFFFLQDHPNVDTDHFELFAPERQADLEKKSGVSFGCREKGIADLNSWQQLAI